jgi:excisionase family DNA binding protein
MWLTIEEIARYLKVSKETIYKMVQQNQIPASKLGNQWRFHQETVDDWLTAQSNFQIYERKVGNE